MKLGSLGFSDVQELKAGDIIFECEYGNNICVRVLEAPTVTEEGERKQASWIAEVVGDKNGHFEAGSTINYLVTEGYMHYGPKLYYHKQYA